MLCGVAGCASTTGEPNAYPGGTRTLLENGVTTVYDGGNFGYDAQTEEFGDMFDLGIIDPAKVTRAAVENAVSVAGMILTTESLITDQPMPEPAMPGGMPPGGGGMDF